MRVGVENCAGAKSLGPEGFTLAFFKHCWSTVKLDVLSIIDEFQEG